MIEAPRALGGSRMPKPLILSCNLPISDRGLQARIRSVRNAGHQHKWTPLFTRSKRR